MIKNPPVKNGQKQFDRFVETAHKLGCDEDKERFEAQLGKIATAKIQSKKGKDAKKTKKSSNR